MSVITSSTITTEKIGSRGPRHVNVTWTREGSVQLDDTGEWVNTFQCYTYAARVEFEDGPTVVVLLPNGAAARPHHGYTPAVVNYALRMERTGEKAARLPERHILVTETAP